MSHRMGDRELLELVAKAAGYEISGWHKNGYAITEEGGWNPLTDDGDALRLAVKLEMKIEVNRGENSNHAWAQAIGQSTGKSAVDECADAATRRAIVMAAAEVGRRKQQEAK